MPTQIAIFRSAREVIKAEKLCRDNNITVKVMPVPEHLSSECGMCLYIANTEMVSFHGLLCEHDINVTIHNDDRKI